jgi:predicted extracellular nuclease
VELFNRRQRARLDERASVQYASATGTGSFATGASLPNATVPAGGYFLVQMASGGTVGSALPRPDATGDSSMAAGAGKVVLATGTTSLGCNGGSTPCTATQRARIVDLVGYGSANFFEGTGAAPGLTNTTAALRKLNGAQDTDDNAADFTSGVPAPRNSASGGGTTDPEPPAQGRGVAISEIQGEGTTSPIVGQDVVATGTATSLFFTNDAVSGFFMQSRPEDDDRNASTSEGVFVNCGTSCPTGLAESAVYAVRGTVREVFTTTTLDPTGSGSVTQVGTGTRPTPATVNLPAAGPTTAPATFSRFDGMLVTIPDQLTVDEFFELDRFGRLVLSSGPVPYTYTHVAEPSASGLAEYNAELAKRRIVLASETDDQNDATSGPDSNEPVPLPAQGRSDADGGGLRPVHHQPLPRRRHHHRPHRGDAARVRHLAPAPGQQRGLHLRPVQPAEQPGRAGAAEGVGLQRPQLLRDDRHDVVQHNGPCGPAGTADCRGGRQRR